MNQCRPLERCSCFVNNKKEKIMKVKQLLKKLEGLDPEIEVVVDDWVFFQSVKTVKRYPLEKTEWNEYYIWKKEEAGEDSKKIEGVVISNLSVAQIKEEY